MSPPADEPTGESQDLTGQEPAPEEAVLEEAERKFLAAREAFIADREARGRSRHPQ